jgi:hypothetical protein
VNKSSYQSNFHKLIRRFHSIFYCFTFEEEVDQGNNTENVPITNIIAQATAMLQQPVAAAKLTATTSIVAPAPIVATESPATSAAAAVTSTINSTRATPKAAAVAAAVSTARTRAAPKATAASTTAETSECNGSTSASTVIPSPVKAVPAPKKKLLHYPLQVQQPEDDKLLYVLLSPFLIKYFLLPPFY